ncbi:dTDP-glucose 4,6-dehydratase [Rickettsiales endosymbiont of Stachyamoeba lipophora]|uniref:dTDP-glucose 4,6-dehydratase n=1 Tax=Rickettsiales endosymbiont of Stachyamoeba lipophora TaxID=2486578 RepID=UPI000F64AF74|nr:dTDP-glucose 4,6-dehydratase [Rickettsiales endosymbiont of Stachyamoeba lipophora]AZL15320.1 dTDP-glucose 4,6-dehydratase [Rickettsiales endosymbiont of Stachyamoeba lipophora]
MNFKSVLITGGLGFIGSNFASLIKSLYPNLLLVILDKVTYAASESNIDGLDCQVVYGDIADKSLVGGLLNKYNIDLVVNFAAESHVDNSINDPDSFVQTNIVGTYNLLNACLNYYLAKQNFLFLHISTDEVYGSLGESGYFTERSNYQPNSPYSASKAASDHLVRAWFHTYNLPVIITNCSNNYGPRQHSEKFIPKIIHCLINKQDIPIYGNGLNIRDWIHVDDHARGILLAILKGKIGESYCFGGDNEQTNIDIARLLCEIFAEISPGFAYGSLIKLVEDRKGHDFRYAIDSIKAKEDLGYKAQHSDFRKSLKDTIKWYINLNQLTKAL